MRKLFPLILTLVLITICGIPLLSATIVTAGTAIPITSGDGCKLLAGGTYPTGHILFGPNSFQAGQQIRVTGTQLNMWVDYGSGPTPVFSNFDGTFSYTFTQAPALLNIFTPGPFIESAACVNTSSDDGRLFYDGRLNWMDPHAPVVIYATETGMDIYAADGSGLIFSVLNTPSDATEVFNNYLFLGTDAATVPAEHMLLWSGEYNGLTIEFYHLSNGAFQFMIGPDADGNVYAKIFDAMPPTTIENVSFNINNPNHREW